MPRPKADIPEDKVEQLAIIGATEKEIGDFYGVSDSCISKRFSSIIAKARASGKTRLRQLQWREAEKGNWKMMIWLGKQMLGQSERNDVTSAGEKVNDNPNFIISDRKIAKGMKELLGLD